VLKGKLILKKADLTSLSDDNNANLGKHENSSKKRRGRYVCRAKKKVKTLFFPSKRRTTTNKQKPLQREKISCR
jgi:hypothetical protein